MRYTEVHLSKTILELWAVLKVEFYMTKFSFLTVFFSVCVSAPKMPCLLPRGEQILCCVYVGAKKAPCLLKRLIYFSWKCKVCLHKKRIWLLHQALQANWLRMYSIFTQLKF